MNQKPHTTHSRWLFVLLALLSIVIPSMTLADSGGDLVYTQDIGGVNYTIRVFNTSGTYTVSFAHPVEVLVVGGGGGGGTGAIDDNGAAGGGGGGGVNYTHNYSASGSIPVVVGLGGTSNMSGNYSRFGDIYVMGGGYGGSLNSGQGAGHNGGAGGSGGGGSGCNTGVNATCGNNVNGGDGNSTQGYRGGKGAAGSGASLSGGGGGGCSVNGTAASGGTAGSGGAGCTFNMTTPIVYGSGGGGTGWSGGGAAAGTNGGSGVGTGRGNNGVNGTGGGGGAGDNVGGGMGGTGIVILRYLTSYENDTTQNGTIYVEKVIVGGNLTIGNVTLHINSTNVTNASNTTLPNGTYYISETLLEFSSNYTLTYSGDCDADGLVSIVQNQSVTCILTNTYFEPTPPPDSIFDYDFTNTRQVTIFISILFFLVLVYLYARVHGIQILMMTSGVFVMFLGLIAFFNDVNIIIAGALFFIPIMFLFEDTGDGQG